MAGSERIGDCDVLFELASGGMATILLARQIGDAGFERLVALKRVHRHLVEDPDVFAMASDEARLAALVRHANVVAVTGVLDAGGELVLVQEYVEGFGLARLLRELERAGERLEPAIASRILVDAAKGLHATHEARDLLGAPLEIVHRDVSPQNLLVGTDGSTRLIDFGIARAERRMTATRTGILKGKLAYMAPEQIGEQPVDRRADVFAAGAVLFEALTGERAFTGNDDASVMSKILMSPPDTAAVRAACPALEAVVRRALEKAPEERFATAAELGKAVAAAVPPADEEDVRALVERVLGAEVVRLRERIAASIARASGPEVEDADAGQARSNGGETPVAAFEDAATKPTARGWPALAGIGGAAALLAVLVATRGPSSSAEQPRRSNAPVSSALPALTNAVGPQPSAIPRMEASSAPEPPATSAPSASASARPVLTPRKTAPSASATPSAKPDLHPSPYSSGR